ncbi:hypothetical protein [Cytobacillus sp.]|uniref:hypothetical protein n=1 Tax=Cytobacillus sp. TaxID=2675269 RepID=UPI0028BD770A|nr:hypothetical protein [Cytobacillus sp.]
MNKILVPLMTLYLLTGCSNITAKNNDLQIADALISIGEVSGTFDKQKINYEFTISGKGNVSIIDNSIEFVLTDWTNEKLIEHKTIEKSFHEDKILVKGYVIFDSKDLTKKDIIKNEPFINGVKIRNKNEEVILFKYD